MITVRTRDELNRARHDAGASVVGFVPTMGALHAGHMALVDRSVQENDLTVCSVFVNPRQFDNRDDFAGYPRDEAADAALLERHGCGIAFVPSEEEIYPGDEGPAFDFGTLTSTMEGPCRPGHFAGMAAVVWRLFRIVEPDRAYFGEKDFQQLAVVRSLVRQAGLNVAIVGCPTVREGDGLAMSSRNVRLTPGERRQAGIIYAALQQAGTLYRQGARPRAVQDTVRGMIEGTGLFRLEYFEMADERTLAPLTGPDPAVPARAFIAVKASTTRLIDNMAI